MIRSFPSPPIRLAAEYDKHDIRVITFCPLLSDMPLFENFVCVLGPEESVKKFLFSGPLG